VARLSSEKSAAKVHIGRMNARFTFPSSAGNSARAIVSLLVIIEGLGASNDSPGLILFEEGAKMTVAYFMHG
jgi:hypothetical protein